MGAGHAHLLLMTRADELRRAGIEARLLAPPGFDYSGLATGVLSGAVSPLANRLDVARIAGSAGVAFRAGEAARILAPDRCVETREGEILDYDILSLNIGSRIRDPLSLAQAADVYPAKPLSSLARLRVRLETLCAEGWARAPALVVAGTGPGGFEIAAVLEALSRRLWGRSNVTLVGPDPEAGFVSARARDRLLAGLDRRGLIRRRGRVCARSPGSCRLEAGEELACDALVLATGLVGPELLLSSGLPLDPDGRMIVSTGLVSMGDEQIFGVGDCAVIRGHERPPLGVFGVRAAPFLLAALQARAGGPPARPYLPQSRYLSILDLGDGSGLALYGSHARRGRAALWLKRRLDEGFLNRMRRLER